MNKKNDRIQLNVIGLSHVSNNRNVFALILEEVNVNRRLRIIIGELETQSIVIFLEGILPKRPLTHDLLVKLCMEHNIEIVEVEIYKMEEGTFYSKILCEDYKGDIKEIDSRTSDAISLALRFECPIYVDSSIMEKSGVEINYNKNDAIKPIINVEKLTKCDIKQLEKNLEDAVKKEDFEKAVTIRDIIFEKRRN